MKKKYPNTYINLYICNVQQFVHLVDYFHTWGDADISHEPKTENHQWRVLEHEKANNWYFQNLHQTEKTL